MTHVPSWHREIHPRNCFACSKSCREMDDWSVRYRELCSDCLEMFCRTCSLEHTCEKKDYPDVEPALKYRGHRYAVPGRKAAFIEKYLPGVVFGGYTMHTAGWGIRLFLPTNKGQVTLYRESLEEICEGLKAAWIMSPTSTLEPSPHVCFSREHPDGKHGMTPPPEVPEGCENGVMIHLEHVL